MNASLKASYKEGLIVFDFEKPKIEIKEMSEDNRYGKFVVEPLERGYGITLGNSLRRIMLSSLPGAAVSQIKIEGVLHEFSSIPGVKEDVTEIVMNVKSLEIKNNSETNEPKIAYIEHEGEGVVTAADIQVDQDMFLEVDGIVGIIDLTDDEAFLVHGAAGGLHFGITEDFMQAADGIGILGRTLRGDAYHIRAVHLESLAQQFHFGFILRTELLDEADAAAAISSGRGRDWPS